MTTLKTGMLCGLATLISVGAIAEPRPDQSVGVSAKKQVPGANSAIMTCSVDPAITRITLVKGKAPGSARITVDTRNIGRSGWQSGPRQQVLSLSVRNGASGAVSAHSWPLAASAAAGASMGSFTTPMIANAFDSFEFRGTVKASISYEPDIGTDGNACNDDSNATNNVKEVNDGQVADFLASKTGTMGF
jgi:hypothetical protein